MRAKNRAKKKKSQKLLKSYRVDKDLRPAAAYEQVQKHKVNPVYRGDLINYIVIAMAYLW